MKRLSPAIVITTSVVGCSRDVPIEHVVERYPDVVNPRDENHRTLYKARDGSCYVTLPFETEPSSAGVPPATRTVDCPETMRDPAWDQCIGNDVRANPDRTACVCDVSGNPPPPTVPRIPCPKTP